PANVGISDVATAQGLANFLNSKLHSNVVSIVAKKDAILFRIHFDQSLFPNGKPQFPFAFDLAQNLGFVNFSGSGNIQVGADVNFTLTLGVSTNLDSGEDFLDRVFLVTDGPDASSVSVHVTANAGYDNDGNGTPDTQPLDFQASVGPLNLAIDDARAL